MASLLSILTSTPATAAPSGTFGGIFQAAISDATERQGGSNSAGSDARPAVAGGSAESDQDEGSQSAGGDSAAGTMSLAQATNRIAAWAENGASSRQIATAQIATASSVAASLAGVESGKASAATLPIYVATPVASVPAGYRTSGAASDASQLNAPVASNSSEPSQSSLSQVAAAVADQVASVPIQLPIQLPAARSYGLGDPNAVLNEAGSAAGSAEVQQATSTFAGLRPSVPAAFDGRVASEQQGGSPAAGGNDVAGTLAQSTEGAGISGLKTLGSQQVQVAADVATSVVPSFAAKEPVGQTYASVSPAPIASGRRASGTVSDASQHSASTVDHLSNSSQPSQSSLSQVAADQVAAVLPQPTIANPVAQSYASAGSDGDSGGEVRRGASGAAAAPQGTQVGIANSDFIFRAPLTQANQLPVAGTATPVSGSGQDAGSAASSAASAVSADVSRQAGSLSASTLPVGATATAGNQAGSQTTAAQVGSARRATDAVAATAPVAATIPAAASSAGSTTALPIAAELLNAAAMNLQVAIAPQSGAAQQPAVATQKDSSRIAGAKSSDATSISGTSVSSAASRNKDGNATGDSAGDLTVRGGQNSGSLGGGSLGSSSNQSNGQPAQHSAAEATPAAAAGPRVADAQAPQAVSVPAQAVTHTAATTAAALDGGAGASRETLARNDSAGLPQEVDDVAPVSGINAARVIQSMGGTEMHVGMRSTEFGDISIRTFLSPQLMTTQISVDHSDLGQAISAHAQGVQARFQEQYGMQASIEVNRQGASTSGEPGSSPQREQQGFVRSASVENASVSTESDVGLSQLAALGADNGYRLDIRA